MILILIVIITYFVLIYNARKLAPAIGSLISMPPLNTLTPGQLYVQYTFLWMLNFIFGWLYTLTQHKKKKKIVYEYSKENWSIGLAYEKKQIALISIIFCLYLLGLLFILCFWRERVLSVRWFQFGRKVYTTWCILEWIIFYKLLDMPNLYDYYFYCASSLNLPNVCLNVIFY